ncbi:MAG: nucleotidyltransferase domain-containing protein [Burkholderiaceae bacterium]|nr:nucleotidyltransferase domain-containing protein [Burkholderiaceae bacterium]
MAMVDIETWIENYKALIQDRFGDRVWFVGLQGSYARGEATDDSDIDVVIILDELSASDIQLYNRLLDELPHRDLICGFLSGREELQKWAPTDLFQFYNDTVPIKGCLDELLASIDDAVVKRAIQMSVCNLYHACVHNMLHEKSDSILSSLYKSATFVVQAIVYLETGTYLRKQTELLNVVSLEERKILEAFARIKQTGINDFQNDSELLFVWLQTWIKKLV